MSARENPILYLQAWQKLRRAGSPVAIAEATLAGLDNAIGQLIGDGADRHVDDGHVALLEALDAVLRDKAATAQEIINVAKARGSHEAVCLDLALREALRAMGSPLTSRWLGNLLNKYLGARVAGTKRLTTTGFRDHSRLWRITPAAK